MKKATWNGTVIAESDKTVEVEGNAYFPPDSIKKEFFKESAFTSVCPWKGTAKYYSLEVNGQKNEDAAWTYPTPLDAAKEIKNHIAFWKGVNIS